MVLQNIVNVGDDSMDETLHAWNGSCPSRDRSWSWKNDWPVDQALSSHLGRLQQHGPSLQSRNGEVHQLLEKLQIDASITRTRHHPHQHSLHPRVLSLLRLDCTRNTCRPTTIPLTLYTAIRDLSICNTLSMANDEIQSLFRSHTSKTISLKKRRLGSGKF